MSLCRSWARGTGVSAGRDRWLAARSTGDSPHTCGWPLRAACQAHHGSQSASRSWLPLEEKEGSALPLSGNCGLCPANAAIREWRGRAQRYVRERSRGRRSAAMLLRQCPTMDQVTGVHRPQGLPDEAPAHCTEPVPQRSVPYVLLEREAHPLEKKVADRLQTKKAGYRGDHQAP